MAVPKLLTGHMSSTTASAYVHAIPLSSIILASANTSNALMAQPVLVRAYAGKRSSADRTSSSTNGRTQALPPVASFAFADILRSADSPELQSAIDGIAEIAAKNRMSLADEYASHLPPLGEITAATSSVMRPHLLRPGGGMRRALTSVPEASSGSSEGSHKSKKRKGIFNFRKQQIQDAKPMRRMRIGRMGRTIPVDPTTALTSESWSLPDRVRSPSASTVTTLRPDVTASNTQHRVSSAAESALQQLLVANRSGQIG